ncbi:NAD(P)/FAD-dependent oxidoreductase [Actinophytocola sp.]|uniref:NAD(P)/FAD-dependent oxidoreductase n=1 Tax=Actinophytocola sp. TaxID=1872138 RepID=UPI003D6BAAF0
MTPDHAVVIGASLAGVLAARVLADHFDRVTVVERDALPDTPEPRSGTPQAKHPHILFAGGRHAMDALVPGLSEDLVAAGAVPVVLPRDLMLRNRAGWLDRDLDDRHSRGGLHTLSFSRPLLDWAMGRRVLTLPSIETLERREVVGLLVGGGAVRGVRVRDRSTGDTGELRADLVVDASGRTSRAPRWLSAAGLPEPRESRVTVHPGYATRVFRRAEPFGDWKSMIVLAYPGSPRGGVLLPMEGDRWIASLNGMGDDHPPTDGAGFLAFARSLATTLLHNTIKDCEPDGPVLGFRHGDNVARHHEKSSVDGLLVTGDAFRSFNPVHGQGMTVTATGARVLAECLAEGLSGLAPRFHRALARSAAPAWQFATGQDMRYPVADGPPRRLPDRLVGRFIGRVEHAAVAGGPATRAFLEVMQMVSPPSVLFRPRVLCSVLRARPVTTAAPPLAQLSGD